MVRKAIYHINRGVVIGLEIFGVVAIAVFLGWVGLIWRLSQGPMDVDFLTDRLEKALNEQQTGFVFDVSKTRMIWGGRFEPFELELQHMEVHRSDKTPVLIIEKVGVLLSKRNLVFGRIVPKEIKVYGPALRVVRQEDGRFALNIAEVITEPAVAGADHQKQLIKGLLSRLEEGGELGALFGGLHKITVSEAAVLYEDRILNVSWKSKRADIIFARSKGGLVSNAVFDVGMDAEHTAMVRASISYGWKSGRTNAVLYFSGFVPALLAQQSAQLKELSHVNVMLKGSLSLDLDADFKPGLARFILGGAPGTFNALDIYAKPIDIKYLYLNGQYDIAQGRGEIRDMKLDIGVAKAEARGSIVPQEGGRLITAEGTLTGMPVDDLKTYWPEKLAPEAWRWVTKNLSKGTADKATLDIGLLYDPVAEKKVKLQSLGGEIDFHGIRVDYLSPLMPVEAVSGKAVYDSSSFNLDIKTGKLGDMTVAKSAIKISDLDKITPEIHANIDIAVSLEGPLKTALKVLDGKPLEYPKALGIDTADVAGNAAVDVGFKFPLYNGLQMQDIAIKATAKLSGAALGKVVAEYALANAAADLTVNNDLITVKGNGHLGGMPVTFDWAKNFHSTAAYASKVTARLPMDGPMLGRFGVPADFSVADRMDADIIYTTFFDGTGALQLKGDITPLSFAVPMADFTKRAGIPGTLDMSMLFKSGKPQRIPALELKTEGVVLKGQLDFSPDSSGGYGMNRAVFDELRFGNSDIRLEVENRNEAGYTLKASGKQLDISRLLSDSEKPVSEDDVAQETLPLMLTLSVDKLMTGPDKFIDGVKMFLHRNKWARLEQLEMDGKAGGKAVYLRYLPVTEGHTLRFEADNAGAALSAFGISKSIRGGKLVVDGRPAATGPRDLKGSVMLTDFALKDAPVLARLLNAMSLPGVLQLLTGESGMAFKKARADFIWTDRSLPADKKNLRMIRVGDGQTSGASLGLTFEGTIDNLKKIYDLNGTLVPVSDLNKLLGIIPLLGDVLTAGGEGIIAATYTIKGPMDQPTVTVNPLSVLAPGILRKLFFE